MRRDLEVVLSSSSSSPPIWLALDEADDLGVGAAVPFDSFLAVSNGDTNGANGSLRASGGDDVGAGAAGA